MFISPKSLLCSFLLYVVVLVPVTVDARSVVAPADVVILTINGAVSKPQRLTAADLAKLPRRSVSVKAPDGSVTTYEGPLLSDVLTTAGVVFGPDLKGEALANSVVVTGADKFRVVFALAELDSSFTEHVVILADKRDGQLLTSAEGPLRSIAGNEKRQSRWVKQVTTLTVISAPKMKDAAKHK